MDNTNSFGFSHQTPRKPVLDVVPLRITSRRVTFQQRNFASEVEQPRSFRTFSRVQVPTLNCIHPPSGQANAQRSRDENQVRELNIPMQIMHDQQQQNNSDFSHSEPDLTVKENPKESSSGSSQSFSSHEQVCVESNDANDVSSFSSGEQAKYAVTDRLDTLRNMVGAFFYFLFLCILLTNTCVEQLSRTTFKKASNLFWVCEFSNIYTDGNSCISRPR